MMCSGQYYTIEVGSRSPGNADPKKSFSPYHAKHPPTRVCMLGVWVFPQICWKSYYSLLETGRNVYNSCNFIILCMLLNKKMNWNRLHLVNLWWKLRWKLFWCAHFKFNHVYFYFLRFPQALPAPRGHTWPFLQLDVGSSFRWRQQY